MSLTTNVISKAQWEEIEERLKNRLFATVEFSYKGRRINVSKEWIAENKQSLIVYIDGIWCLGLQDSEHKLFDPIAHEVWRKRSRQVYPPKEKARMVKGLGKRMARKILPNLDKVIVMYMPDFSTAKSLVRQFKKLQGIELLESSDDI